MTAALPLPEQAPLHPAKVEPAPGVGVKVTDVPWLKLAAQVPALQLIPAGALVTVPEPLPAKVTDRDCWMAVKVTVQARCCGIVTLSVTGVVDGPMALQLPVALVNVDPASGLNVSVTVVVMG